MSKQASSNHEQRGAHMLCSASVRVGGLHEAHNGVPRSRSADSLHDGDGPNRHIVADDKGAMLHVQSLFCNGRREHDVGRALAERCQRVRLLGV